MDAFGWVIASAVCISLTAWIGVFLAGICLILCVRLLRGWLGLSSSTT